MMEIRVRSLSYNTLVIGTGASGYNAADTLYQLGVRKFAIISENIKSGTSRNTGSDKQTYYKLSLSGDYPDSVGKMAEVYFNGQCTDGEHALIESALSTQCFFKLVNLYDGSCGTYFGTCSTFRTTETSLVGHLRLHQGYQIRRWSQYIIGTC